MKYFALIITILAFGCSTSNKTTNTVYEGQSLNREILDTNINQQILYGLCDRAGLQSSPVFGSFFVSEYSSYIPQDILKQINPELWSELKVTIVLGTWCDDSRREVPRFFKILDYNKITPGEVEIICVDRKKNSEGLTEHLDVTYVPVFIFYINGAEIGRITETPLETIENDMFNLLRR